MPKIENYEHLVASHCESGSVRNILKHSGFDISEPMAFGIGSGVVFAYMFFAKGPAGFPVNAIRLPMGVIVKNVSQKLDIDMYQKKFKNTQDAFKVARNTIRSGKPVTLCVDMFYMKYLPKLMQIHVPFHFIVIIGYENNTYYISDPYYQGIGELSEEELKLAWDTHALFAKDNFLAYVKNPPQNPDWKSAIKKSLSITCRNMLLGPGVNKILPIFGVFGIRYFAKKMLEWPKKYRGLQLREGMLYVPTIFEEQGTGGGAFRLIYGAFLQEAAEILNHQGLNELADEMIDNGLMWRDASRDLISTAKEIPIRREAYTEWITKNASFLDEGLQRSSKLFLQRADEEEKIFKKLKKIVKELK
ncbi:MAG: BtrH N-terminal domain-containing protein [Spirochaetes bacterium]|nr:BtrH N-terminal domain-containing protein [Spirochaetota bacterium]